MTGLGEQFLWSDAWLLLSLIYARKPADRAEIIRIGDGINHAIFTDEELEGGLRRLIAARLIVEQSGRFTVVGIVFDWFETVSSERSWVSKDFDRVMDFLQIDESA